MCIEPGFGAIWPVFSRWRWNFFAAKLFVSKGVGRVVRITFARRSLRGRIIALFAAYAIALAGVVASFGAAQSAAQAADQEGGVICHSDLATGPATGSHNSNGDICLKTCIGCIASLATVIPPTVAAAGLPQVSFKRLDPPTCWVRLAETKSSAHRSRGPPSTL
jgi:hypothetical protein